MKTNCRPEQSEGSERREVKVLILTISENDNGFYPNTDDIEVGNSVFFSIFAVNINFYDIMSGDIENSYNNMLGENMILQKEIKTKEKTK